MTTFFEFHLGCIVIHSEDFFTEFLNVHWEVEIQQNPKLQTPVLSLIQLT